MKTVNRELSWLSFNERVLQEAMDERVPLIERIRFLGIYSNNMDEFYRVRVANIRRVINFRKSKVAGFKGSAEELYKEIRRVVLKQQEKFEFAYQEILAGLKLVGIVQLNEKTVTEVQKKELASYFHKELKHAIFPIMLNKKDAFPRLRDYAIYLAVKINLKGSASRYSLIQVPSVLPRFFTIKEDNCQYVLIQDDIIRLHLHEIFAIYNFTSIEAYTFKFTRDAELDLDDDLSLSFFEKVEKGIKQRKKGVPVRFVYDETMPKDFLEYLLRALGLSRGINTIPGGRYHNFKDFINYPAFDLPDLQYPKQAPCDHPLMENAHSLLDLIAKQDLFLYFPYQKFDYIVDLLREAAIDPDVKHIKINIYRVAKNSQIMNALLAAVFNGKDVTVIMELQARFDEENNLYWSNRLRDNGAKVIHGAANLKVHSKMIQISRYKDKKEHLFSYVGTGNFNEKSAKTYTDFALLTSDKAISNEIKKVFGLLENNLDRMVFRHLIVSPINTRRKIYKLIDTEIGNAKMGKAAGIKIKLNNLTDLPLIEKLYEASAAGVKIEMIIRGICCLKTNIKGLSENITVISIVDRYLEHARMLIFENEGNPLFYILSADFMERNIDYRIEVGVPIYCKTIQEDLSRVFDFQWKGSVKSRLITGDLKNVYRKTNLSPFHAQVETYKYYLDLALNQIPTKSIN
ncbi:MAG: polyphosphate kinase 1 [Flavobacteriia bacterium]|nr:polyphosphate kinase 1 [Flavobacteriia bacterium]